MRQLPGARKHVGPWKAQRFLWGFLCLSTLRCSPFSVSRTDCCCVLASSFPGSTLSGTASQSGFLIKNTHTHKPAPEGPWKDIRSAQSPPGMWERDSESSGSYGDPVGREHIGSHPTALPLPRTDSALGGPTNNLSISTPSCLTHSRFCTPRGSSQRGGRQAPCVLRRSATDAANLPCRPGMHGRSRRPRGTSTFRMDHRNLAFLSILSLVFLVEVN